MSFLEKINGRRALAFFTVIVFAVYANALFNQFLWDDGFLIVSNHYIKNWQFLPNLFRGDLVDSTMIRDVASGYYRPLSMLWFMVDYHFWGLNPFGFHLTNVLIHLINVVLVYRLVWIVTGDKAVGFLSGILFAVHPIHVEAVTPIYNRMGLQATMFALMSLLCFIDSQKFKKWPNLAASLIFLGLGLFSKEEVVVLPAVCAAFHFLFWRKGPSTGGNVRHGTLYYVLSAVVVGVYLAVRAANVDYRFLSKNMGALWGHTLAENWFWHILTAVKITALYFVKIFWPFSLSPLYMIFPVKSFGDPWALGGILCVVGLVSALFVLFKVDRPGAFFIGLFVLTVGFFSNILPIAEVYTFRERFAYWPSVSACFAIAAVFWNILRRKETSEISRRLLTVLFVVLAVTWGLKTVEMNYVWRNNLTLWRYAVIQEPESQMAHLNLGETYKNMGRNIQAMEELRRSLDVNSPKALSSVYLARVNIAAVLLDGGQYPQARDELQEAVRIAEMIRLNPASAYDKLGLVSVKINEPKKAEEYFRRAIFYNENFLPSRYNLAVLYYTQKRYAQCQAELLWAMVDRDFSEAHYLFSLTLLAEGRMEQARGMLETIVRRSPGFLLARRQLEHLKKVKE